MLPKRVFFEALFFCLIMLGCNGFFTDNPGDGGGTTTVGKFVYVVNNTSGVQGSVAGFLMNSGSGALTAVTNSPFPAGTAPTAIGADAAGKFVYVTGSDGVVGYIVGRNDGTLSAVQQTPFATGTNPVAVAVTPNGHFVYLANKDSGNITGYTINTTTGVLVSPPTTTTVGTGTAPVGAVVDPSGRFLFVAAGAKGTFVFKINSTTGVLTAGNPVSTGACATASSAVVVEPFGQFAYVADGANGVCMYAINPNNGDLLQFDNIIQTGPQPVALAANPDGKFLFVVDKMNNEVSAYVIHSDGTLTADVPGSPFNAGGTPISISVDPASKFAYVVNAATNSADGKVSIFSIGSNGALTSAGTVSTGLQTPVAVITTP